MMKSGKPVDGYLWMRSALGLLGPFTPAIWIARLGSAFIPALWKVCRWFKMLKFSDECMSDCMKASHVHLVSPVSSRPGHVCRNQYADRCNTHRRAREAALPQPSLRTFERAARMQKVNSFSVETVQICWWPRGLSMICPQACASMLGSIIPKQ